MRWLAVVCKPFVATRTAAEVSYVYLRVGTWQNSPPDSGTTRAAKALHSRDDF
jgi:hypothetical protein